MQQPVREGVSILDNVTVILTDTVTGATRTISAHNTPLNGAFSLYSQWDSGTNNTGQNALTTGTIISLGSGTGTPAVTDTGLFSPIAGATASISYAQANQPSNGTTTKVWQIGAGKVTTQVTEALMSNSLGTALYHTMFSAAFTPASTETITIQWETTFAA